MSANGTVYLVDDEPGMLKALTRLLRAEGLTVHAFRSAEDFLSHERPGHCACLVLDVAMPGISGLELQQRLSALGNPIPIIFLSGHGDIPMSVRAMKSGALDFLTKPVNDAELLDAVRTAVRFSRERGELQLEVAGLRSRLDRLTPREKQVMTRVAAGMLSKQIAAELGTGEQTVKVHRMRMMEKMGARSVAELVRMVDRLDGEERPQH